MPTSYLGAMWSEREIISLELTQDEAFELFARCLKSADEDNEASRSALRKLGLVLDATQTRRAA